VAMGWQSANDKKSFTNAILTALSKEYGFSLDTPFGELPQDIQHMMLHGGFKEVKVYYKGQRGEGVYPITFEGIVRNVQRKYRETASDLLQQKKSRQTV